MRYVYDPAQDKVVPKHERTAPRIHNIARDWEGIVSPKDGTFIEGRAAHREHMAKHGLRLLEPGETRDHAKERMAALNELRAGMHPADTYGYGETSESIELRFKR